MTHQDDILIVDDTTESLEYLSDILTDAGYGVRVANSGERALESVRSHSPSLILLDILMPGMDGFEVCRRLKAQPENHHIPVLFISGIGAIKEKVEGFTVGAVDFISKPFQQEELLARVRTHLELNRLRTDLETQVHARTEELRISEAKMRSLFAAMSDIIIVLNGEGQCLEIAPTRTSIFDKSPQECLGKFLRNIFPEKQNDLLMDTIRDTLTTGQTNTVDCDLTTNQSIFWFSATISPLANDKVIMVARDITERKQIEVSLWEISIRDQLTGLYNRRGFITLAQQQIKTAERGKRLMPLVFVDVDDMKGINDNLGHEEGDRALSDAASILRQTFRESDIIARIGGDEFAILATDVTEMNPDILSERLQQNIDAFNQSVAQKFKLSMSWGIAIYNPETPITLDELMSAADGLMYAQKKTKSFHSVTPRL